MSELRDQLDDADAILREARRKDTKYGDQLPDEELDEGDDE